MEHTVLQLVFAIGFGIAAGGVVKGVAGIGLPLVAVPIMTLAVDVPTAVSLMIFPILASNVWQAVRGGRWRKAVRRFWPLLVAQPVATVAGVAVLANANQRLLIGVLGVIVVLFVAAMQFMPAWEVPPSRERLLSPLAGLVSGFLGGLASFLGLPIAMYLLALRLDKDDFIATVGVTFTSGGLVLMLALMGFGLFGAQLWLWSALAVPAVFIGMKLGEILRHRMDTQAFRKVVLAVLFLVGLNLVRKGLMG